MWKIYEKEFKLGMHKEIREVEAYAIIKENRLFREKQ
jgi:hypothetical protein